METEPTIRELVGCIKRQLDIDGTVAHAIAAAEKEIGLEPGVDTLLERAKAIVSALGVEIKEGKLVDSSRSRSAGGVPTFFTPPDSVVNSCMDPAHHTAGGIMFTMRRAWVVNVHL